MSQRRIHLLLSLCVMLSLVIQPLGSVAAVTAPVEPLSVAAVDAAARPGFLFRAAVSLDDIHTLARLRATGALVLHTLDAEQTALVLADGEQLSDLARLGYRPRGADELRGLLDAQGPARRWLAESLQPLLAQADAIAAQQSLAGAAGVAGVAAAPDAAAMAVLRAAVQSLTPEQIAATASSISVDDDADGLTNTEEAWWCTDPLNPNSDGDASGYTDGQEVTALLDFTLSRTVRWNYGPPFGPPAAWPNFNNRDGTGVNVCNDGDYDTIPDYAEAYMVGTRVGTGDSENTDGDKFDDGQEFFGTTFCLPGQPDCGYGLYPRNQDFNFITNGMPSWIRPPGDSPFVAAYPVIDFLVDPATIEVTTKEIRTIERTITQGEEISTGFAETQGSSTTVGTIDTNTHSTWQENSTTEGGIEPGSASEVGPQDRTIVDVSTVPAAPPVEQRPTSYLAEDGFHPVDGTVVMDRLGPSILFRDLPSNDLSLQNGNSSRLLGVKALSARLLSSGEILFVDPELALKRLIPDGTTEVLLPERRANGPIFVSDDEKKVAFLKPLDFQSGESIPNTNGIAVFDLMSKHEQTLFVVPSATVNLYGWTGNRLVVEAPFGWVTTQTMHSLQLGLLPTDQTTPTITPFSNLPEAKPGTAYPITLLKDGRIAYESQQGTVVASLKESNYSTIPGCINPRLSAKGLTVICNGQEQEVQVAELSVTADAPAETFSAPSIAAAAASFESGAGVQQTTSTVLFYRPVSSSTPVSAYFDLDPDSGEIEDWMGTQITYDGHDGTDYDGKEGDKIFAPAAGTVDSVSKYQYNTYASGTLHWGTTVVINHGSLSTSASYTTRYAHLKYDGTLIADDSAISTLPTIIAEMGNTGYSTGDHLHFGVYENGTAVDPYDKGLISDAASAGVNNQALMCLAPSFKSTDAPLVTLPATSKRTWFQEVLGRLFGGWRGAKTTDSTANSIKTAASAANYLTGCEPNTCASQVVGQTSMPQSYSDLRSNGQCGGNPYPSGLGSVGGGGSGLTLNDNGDGTWDRLRVWSETHTTGEGYSTSHSELRSETSYREITRSETNTLVSSEAWSTATTSDPTDAGQLTFNYNLYNTGSDAAVNLTGIRINVLIGDLPVITWNAPDRSDVLPGGAKGPFGSDPLTLTLEQLAAIDNGAPIRVVLADYGYDDNLYDANAWGRSVLFHVDDGPGDGDETVDTYLITTNLVQGETYQDTLTRYFDVTTFQGAPGDERNGTITGIRTPEFAGDGEITGWNDHPVNDHAWWELSISLGGETDGVQHFRDMPAKAKTDVYLRYVLDTDADGFSDRAELDAGSDPNDPDIHPRPLLTVAQHTTVSGTDASVQVTLQNDGNLDASSVELWAIAPDDSITINDNLVGGGGRVRAGRQVVLGARIGRPDLTEWQTSTAKPYPDGQYEGTSPKTFKFQALDSGNVESGTLRVQWSNDGGATWQPTPLALGSGYAAWTPLPLSDGLSVAFSGGYIALNETFTFATALPIDTFAYTINRTQYTAPLIIASYNDPEGNHKFVSDVELADIQADLAPYLGEMRYGFQLDVMAPAPFAAGANTAYLVFNNPAAQAITGANLYVEFATPEGTVAREYVLADQTLLPGPNVVELAWDTADFTPAFDPAADYHILVFAADRQGTIFENTVKDLDQVGHDRLPAAVLPQEDWNFGVAQQGTLLRRTLAVANTGDRDMLTFVAASDPAIGLSDEGSRTVAAGDVTQYEVALNTADLAVGPYDQTITLRSSDPNNPARAVHVMGTITAAPCDGFQAEYFANATLNGSPAVTRCDGILDFDWGTGSPDPAIPADSFSARWTKQFQVHTAGVYTFDVKSDDGVKIYVDDQLVVDYWSDHGFLFATGSKSLTAGEHTLRVEYYENAGGAAIKLVYGPPGTRMYPLDWSAAFTSGTQGQWVEYTHTLGPEPQTLHPVKVYSQNYGTMWGVGKYATAFSAGTASYDMFGDGRDGAMPSSGNLDNNNGFAAGTVNGSLGSLNIAVVDRHAVWRINPGDVVLIHQTQGTGAGNWEINKAISDFTGSGTFALANALKHTYSTSGDTNRAQILRVPQYSTCNVTGTVTPLTAWNGTWGGIFAVTCSNTLNVAGEINADAYGFRGGAYVGNHQRGYSGESSVGPSLQTFYANGNGGGGGENASSGDAHASGGGGGNGAAGTDARQTHGNYGRGGNVVGSANLNSIHLGGGGGGSACGWEWCGSGSGGTGGGIVYIAAKSLVVTGSILARGSNGQNGDPSGWAGPGSGGGGAGGSIKIVASDATVSTDRINARYGFGGYVWDGGTASENGRGGTGRIAVEYCNSLSGSTNPPASTQKLNCYIVEQVETSPYDRARLNLPQSGANTYQVQYGRKLDFTSAVTQTVTSLRVPAADFASVKLDALISNVGTGTLTFKLDIGNDGSWDWNVTPSVTESATLTNTVLANAFNTYWATHGAPLSDTVDVPVKVYLSKAGQVLLTNLQVVPTGSKLRAVRLPVQPQGYNVVQINFTVSGGSDSLAVGADVGDDGTVDWSYSGTQTYPAALTTGNLAAAVNAYLAGGSGEVDVPIRFYLAPFTTLNMTGFTAAPTGAADAGLANADLAFSTTTPSEGDIVTANATVRNAETLDTGPLAVSFYATAAGGTETRIGSAFVANVPAAGAATASLQWNTLGFAGDVPVRAVVDPYNRLVEADETNNSAAATLPIKTRPDLRVTEIAVSEAEPVVGQAVAVTLTLRNDGQTAASASILALYDDHPDDSRVLVCEDDSSTPDDAARTVVCQWTPTTPGLHRLFAQADRDRAVNESNEGNNDAHRDVYVGFAGPIRLDSGGGDAYDPAYSPENGYGYVDEGTPDVIAACGATGSPDDTLRQDPDGHLVYRFEHFQPGHFYHLDIVLRECDGAGRQETISIDGNPIEGPVDLLDGEVHPFSILLDPALYADRTIVVTIDAPGIDGAVVSQVNVHDVDYRYADAGGANDPQYSAASGYGWLDGVKNTGYGALPYQSVRVDQSDNTLRYRFDGLLPTIKYKLRFTFYQSSGGARVQQVEVDGIWTGLEVNTGDYQPHRETVDVPVGAYQDDGSIIVSILRTNASTGAFVNEIALEEQTLQSATTQNLVLQAASPNWISFNVKPAVRPALYCSGVTATSAFSTLAGDAILAGAAAPVNSIVEAYTPAGVKVGCYKVTTAGKYGYMRVYGAEGATPGMAPGEPIQLKINGIASQPTPYPVIWQNDKLTHIVNLAAPDVIPVETFLDPIAGKVVKLQSESGTYLPPPADPRFNTTTTVAPGWGYLLYTNAGTTLGVSGDRVAADTPLALHAGWNWLGYLPTCELPISTALANIAGQYDLINGEAGAYRPPPADPAYNNFNTMAPGKGYMIHMTAATTLTYPATGCGTALQATEGTAAPTFTCPAAATSRFTHFYGHVTPAEDAPVGGVILAYSPRGEVVGCGQAGDGGLYPYLRVYGAEDAQPGMQPGETVQFTVDGRLVAPSVAAIWQNDWDVHPLDLTFDGVRYQYLPLIVR